ncbi:MAG TPA: NAD(P)H-dependent oxidoreductase [Chitinophagaceae bacterium]|nr:NAD(P)H-dependent oxidoreductase [Chitinophagaceae bacterium]
MELLNALEWRYATKKMNGKKVPGEKIEKILQAIQLAPSSVGLQPYSVLVITDPELKQKMLPIANNQHQVVDASHVLVFAAWDRITPERIDEYIQLVAKTRNKPIESLEDFRNKIIKGTTRSDEENFEWAARQTYIAFATGIAAAAELHVDATPMEGFNNNALDELLHLKEKGLKSLTLLPLGYREHEKDWLVNLPKVRREKEKLFLLQ